MESTIMIRIVNDVRLMMTGMVMVLVVAATAVVIVMII